MPFDRFDSTTPGCSVITRRVLSTGSWSIDSPVTMFFDATWSRGTSGARSPTTWIAWIATAPWASLKLRVVV